jgi:hypothetical protein
MKTRKFFPLLACLSFSMLGSLAQAGDGPVVPLPAEDRAAIEQFLGKGVGGEAIPAPAVADTGRYLATKPSTRTFRLVSGDDAGKTEKHQPTLLKQESDGTHWCNANQASPRSLGKARGEPLQISDVMLEILRRPNLGLWICNQATLSNCKKITCTTFMKLGGWCNSIRRGNLPSGF